MVARLFAALSPHAPPLVSALLHSLWQAALVAVFCKVALRAIPVRLPNLRYGLCLGGLSLVALLFVVTWRLECPVHGQAAAESVVTVDAVAAYDMTYQPPPASSRPVIPAPATPLSAPRRGIPWQAVFASVWLLGVLLMVLRAAHALCSERRLASSSRPVDDPAILALLAELREHLGVVRRVALAAVDAACSPAVVGAVAPVILVPAGLLAGTSPMHLRAVLAHELAHIRRWDLLVNMLQLLVESLLFHNPSVWLLSAQIRHEREACCDAAAAECCGGGAAYARVLVDVGEAVLAQNVATSFARPGGLSDRVRRLLGLAPVRDSWRLPARSLFAGLGVAMLALLAVGQGTVKATDAVLSAKDRLQLLERVADQQKGEGPPVVSTEYVARVATPDGGPLPKETRVTARTTSPNCVAYAGGRVDRKTGRFSIRTEGNASWFWVEAPGYAPWFEGPTKPGPEGTTDLGLWVLEPETPLLLRVLDKDEDPIPKATVRVQWQPAKGVSFGGRTRTADVAGECTVPLVSDFSMSLAIEAPGFEPTTFEDLVPADDTPLVLHLPRSIPLQLTVRSIETGSPVRGGRVRLLAQVTGPSECLRENQPDEAPVVATSDAKGACAIDSLHREGRYWLLVDAEGYGPELLERVSPGEPLDVRLGRPRMVRGTVAGRLDQLRTVNGQPTLGLGWSLRYSPHSFYQYSLPAVPVRIADGKGTFEIGGLWAGTFFLGAGDQRTSFSTRTRETEVHVDLAPPNGMREVRIEFVVRQDCPLPRGSVRMSFRGPPEDPYYHHDIPVRDGVATSPARVGEAFRYQAAGTLGGWFPPGEYEKLPAGEGPLTIPVSFVPAGAIALSLVEADGSPATGFMVHVRELAKSPLRGDGQLGVEGKTSSSTDDGISAFTATPLPLGGTYELVVCREFTYVTTGPILLTEKYPLHKQKLVLAGDATIRGEVVDPEGKPLSGVPVSLGLTLAGMAFGSSDVETDEDGSFRFPSVVRHPNTDYRVTLRPRRDFAPQRVTLRKLDRALQTTLERGLVLSGRLVDAEDDAPLAGMEIYLWRQYDGEHMGFNQFQAEGVTDRQGRFRFSNLLPGTYGLRSDRLPYDPQAPQGRAGQKEPVAWRVRRPH